MTESWHNLWELTNEEDNKNIAYVFVGVFLLYMFLSMFTVLNMLIGVLCEVVSAVSKASEEEVKVDAVRETLLDLLGQFDTDGNHTIGYDEYLAFCNHKEAQKALKGLDVDLEELERLAEFLFDHEDDDKREIPFKQFMRHCLEMRKTNTARVFDVNQIIKTFTREIKQVQGNFDRWCVREGLCTNLSEARYRLYRSRFCNWLILQHF